ncbi:MAG: DUF882 domain-containing protein [Deltaproteobacteria bacterium]|nr:DUF882 domain-containing protein [Deltaproteobacteria bacterium]
MNRRNFLGRAMAMVPLFLLSSPSSLLASFEEKTLSFYHTHTLKELSIVYFRNGRHIPSALATINNFLKDFRTGDIHPIDPALLDLLHDLQLATGTKKFFEVISGYRSPQTNAMLHSNSGGVASHSLHMLGKAIDIRLPSFSTGHLHKIALAFQRGGVGYYPQSDFIHIDTGHVRTW